MTWCISPTCQQQKNPDGAKFCQNCGTRLLLSDRYCPIEPIGQGGFGRTFLAIDQYKPSKPRCVIKQFFQKDQGTSDPRRAAFLFQQEAVRLDELGQHPQIPELLAFFEQDRWQYLVQEFIDGPNLAQELKQRGEFSEREIRQVLTNLLPVLKFVHDRQVIHRDIKPQNIIRRRADQQLVLVDFGAAKLMSSNTPPQTGTRIGTAEYIAPEQALGKAVFASDLFSLGLTCLHLLTHKRPSYLFDVSEGTWVWKKHLKQPISNSLTRVLDKMLQGPVKRRYQSPEEVLRDLNDYPVLYYPGIKSVSIPATSEVLEEPATTASFSQSVPASALVTSLPEAESTSEMLTQAMTVDEQDIPAAIAHTVVTALESDPVIETTDLSAADSSLSARLETSNGSDTTASTATLNSEISNVFASSSKLTPPHLSGVLANTPTWTCVHSLAAHSAWVRSIAISPNGQILVSGSGDKTVKIWNLQTGELLHTLTDHTAWVRSVSISLDGQLLASASNDLTIKLWKLETGELLHTFTGHVDWIRAVAFSANGEMVSAGQDKTVKIWRTDPAKLRYTLTGHAHWVLAAAVSPSGQNFATGSRDKTIQICRLGSGRLLCTLTGHNDAVNTIVYSADGRLLASGSDDETIKLWHMGNGSLLRTLTGHTSAVTCLAFSSDRHTLISSSQDKTIKFWNIRTGELLLTLTDHDHWVWAIALSPDGKTLASGSWDGTIKLWRLDSGTSPLTTSSS